MHEARKIVFDVTTLAEKHRNDADRGDAFCNQCADDFIEGGSMFQERESDRDRGKLLADATREALERTRPVGIARSVSEEDDAFLQ
jgi:hypothetical protein